jgi:4-diphosphocytidyl-2-C-methyl-D-erythritol kinase
MKTLTKKANAKINLGLQVLNKRTDGFHNINSIFAPISLYDEITIKESDYFNLQSNVDFGISDDENLVIKAAKKFNQVIGENISYEITLIKNIPMQAGLGGGSSDGATVLKMLNEMHNYPLNNEELSKIALELGSDVPFFIYNRIALATGRGEVLEFLDIELNWNVLVVFPNLNISTREAYSQLQRTGTLINEIDLKKGLFERDFSIFINDFEEYAIKKFSIIKKIKDELLKNGAFFASLSGSGSAIFGLFDDEQKMQEAAKKFLEFTTFLCKILK